MQLNNVAIAEEGGGLVALGREALEVLGARAPKAFPAAPIDGVVNLISALRCVFVFTPFGGLREYHGQLSDRNMDYAADGYLAHPALQPGRLARQDRLGGFGHQLLIHARCGSAFGVDQQDAGSGIQAHLLG